MKKEIESFKKILNEMYDLKRRKAEDYGSCWRIFGLRGILASIGIKFSRLWVLKDKSSKEINFESMRDTFMDLAIYSIMAIQLLDDDDTEDKIEELLKN